MGQQRGVLVFLLLLSFLILACGADSGSRPTPAGDVSIDALARAIVQATLSAETFARATIEAARTATVRAQATQDAQARETVTARAIQATATARAQATREAVEATQTAAASAATQTALQVQATATAQAYALGATATVRADQATATVQALDLQRRGDEAAVAREQAGWEQRLTWIKAIGWTGFFLVILALGLWLLARGIDALILRARVIRSAGGQPIVILGPGPGATAPVRLLLPGRTPGPALTVDEDGAQAEAGDAETTARDQAVELAAVVADQHAAARHAVTAFTSSRYEIAPPDQPPPILDAEAVKAIEAGWKEATDDDGDRS